MNNEEIEKQFQEIIKRLDILEEKLDSKKTPEVDNKNNCDIFEIEDNKVIVTRSIGEKTMDKTQNIALLTLLGYKQKIGLNKVTSSLIRENVAIQSVPLENFGTHLKKLIPQSILRIGKFGNPKVEYKLTTFGEARAKKLLKEVIENE